MDYPKVKVCLDTSEDNLIDELYTPCLKWAERFDRGVGYFTTGWLTYNVAGLPPSTASSLDLSWRGNSSWN